MNYPQIVNQLGDLPTTFKPTGQTYAQLIASFSSGLSSYTDATDEISTESTSLQSARYGWLDVWGLLFGISRNAIEADYNYRFRILAILLAWVGTLPAIENWGVLILNQTISVIENTGSVGYTIIFQISLPTSTVASFVKGLSRIRPAGVPFRVGVQASGLYLDTINYLDSSRVTGAYLVDSLTYLPLGIGPNTNNVVPLLPSLYLNDPTLNPSL